MLQTFKTYYLLTKPGIIRGNLITAVAGFFLASKSNIDLGLLLAVAVGVSLVIASGCVFNNYIDRHIDKKMKRTNKRALVTGAVKGKNAIIYASILGVLGFAVLALFTNLLTVLTGFIGIFFYVVVYGYYKRRSPVGTLVGGVSGSTALVAGYVAVTGWFDMGALILFLIMFIWQMPHFYAIAIYRMHDYKDAGIPVLSVVNGVDATKRQIVAYTGIYIAVVSSLTFFGYTGYTYLIIMLLLSFAWLLLALKGFHANDNIRWAKKVFGLSLIILLVFSLLISFNVVLP